MRRSSLARPFDPERVPDSVRTDADGRFTLPGSAPALSVWHEDWTPVTVRRGHGGRIRLEERGSIRGRLVDEAESRSRVARSPSTARASR